MHRKHERGSQIPGIVAGLCLAAGCFAALAGGKTPASADEYNRNIAENRLALDSVKNELARGREKLKELGRQEGSYVEQLEQLEQNMAVSQTYMKRLDAKIDWTSDTLAVLQQSLDAENGKLARRQAEMKLRLRQIYKAGRIQPVLILLSSRTMSDMLHRARYFRQLHLYDVGLLGRIDSARAQIGVRKAALEAQSAQLSALRTEKQDEQDALAQEQAERGRLLDSVRRQKAAFAATIRELEAEQKQLKNILSALESKHKKGRTVKDRSLLSGFEKQKGSLPWPVEGPVLSEFGRSVHSVYKTVVMNTGIDIKAEKGQTVNCVADGRIAYIGWMRGFGKFAIVDHGGYYSTYAHLDKVAVEADDEVEGGAVLGVVGEPGGGGPPKLHFEVRRSTEALDPREWLERRKR